MRTHYQSGIKSVRLGGVALSALIAASCASVKQELLDAQLPEIPAEWAADAEAATAPTGDWVAAFNDNILYDLIDEAIMRNNDLLAAAANLEQARSGARISRANMLPTFNTSFNASRNAIVTDPTTAATAGGGVTSPTSGLGAKDLERQFGVDADGDGKLDGLDLDSDDNAEAPLPTRRL